MAEEQSKVTYERVRKSIEYRFNPLPSLTPATLTQAHAMFKRGDLRQAALLWDEIEDTDDICKSVANKRKRSAARHGYEIITTADPDKDPVARRHMEVLEYFYDNLICYNALEQNIRGGTPMLLRNMMDAVGKRYSVHELIWDPRGGGLTAAFKFIPLWFFENRTGMLRYLPGDYDTQGTPMKPGEWLVHAGDGVMRACATAYMFKHFPLQDWLILSERFGMNAVKGTSPGKPGDDSWEAVSDAVDSLSGGDSVVLGEDADIEVIRLVQSEGEIPFPKLIERMDRAITVLWRGADLGTLSAADHAGASVQEDETQALEENDTADLTDTLNEQVDRYVIKFALGDATPRAWVRIKPGQNEDLKLDLDIDKGLNDMGYTESLEARQKRYNRPELEIKAGTAPAPAPEEVPNEDPQTAIDAVAAKARGAIAEAVSLDLQPAVDRLTHILETVPDAGLVEALRTFRAEELPAIAAEVLQFPQSAEAIEALLQDAILSGIQAEGGGES